jgi:hypothetical protein
MELRTALRNVLAASPKMAIWCNRDQASSYSATIVGVGYDQAGVKVSVVTTVAPS